MSSTLNAEQAGDGVTPLNSKHLNKVVPIKKHGGVDGLFQITWFDFDPEIESVNFHERIINIVSSHFPIGGPNLFDVFHAALSGLDRLSIKSQNAIIEGLYEVGILATFLDKNYISNYSEDVFTSEIIERCTNGDWTHCREHSILGRFGRYGFESTARRCAIGLSFGRTFGLWSSDRSVRYRIANAITNDLRSDKDCTVVRIQCGRQIGLTDIPKKILNAISKAEEKNAGSIFFILDDFDHLLLHGKNVYTEMCNIIIDSSHWFSEGVEAFRVGFLMTASSPRCFSSHQINGIPNPISLQIDSLPIQPFGSDEIPILLRRRMYELGISCGDELANAILAFMSHNQRILIEFVDFLSNILVKPLRPIDGPGTDNGELGELAREFIRTKGARLASDLISSISRIDDNYSHLNTYAQDSASVQVPFHLRNELNIQGILDEKSSGYSKWFDVFATSIQQDMSNTEHEDSIKNLDNLFSRGDVQDGIRNELLSRALKVEQALHELIRTSADGPNGEREGGARSLIMKSISPEKIKKVQNLNTYEIFDSLTLYETSEIIRKNHSMFKKAFPSMDEIEKNIPPLLEARNSSAHVRTLEPTAALLGLYSLRFFERALNIPKFRTPYHWVERIKQTE